MIWGGRKSEGYEPLECSLTKQQISLDTEKGEFVLVQGFKVSLLREVILWTLSAFTLGFPLLLVFWYPQLCKLRYSSCSLSSASVVLVEDNHGQRAVHKVQATTFRRPGSVIDQPIRIFTHHLMRFVREDETGFRRIKGFESSQRTQATILDEASGLTKEEQENLLVLYGSNIMNITGKPYVSLLFSQVTTPIYIFQVFSIFVWIFDEYYWYAACVAVVAVFSAIIGAAQAKKQIDRMRTLVEPSNIGTIMVCRRDGVCEETDVAHLVPGDVVQIPVSGCIMPCDALVLAGSCIVNEEVLTGESVPVTKSSPIHSNEIFEPSIHRRHVLFRGTEVIQTRYYDQHTVTALVIRTGFASVKGEIIRSILYPRPMGFSFYEDCLKFVMALCAVAAFGMMYCAYVFIRRGASLETIVLRTLDIITIVAPPALPAALTAGTVFADARLKKRGIYSVSSTSINVCGKIKVACFDKTGTMTEEGLNFWAVLPVDQSGFTAAPVWRPAADLPSKSPILVAMASCHTLTRIHEDLCGDPMDLCMFNTTGWELEEPGADDTTRYDLLTPTVVRPPRSQQSKEAEELLWSAEMSDFEIPFEVGIMRTFPFSSRAQCMSVITRTLGAPRMVLYTKGAPEKIIKMCEKDSVTDDFIDLVNYYASAGYRVIALAYRRLEARFSWTKAQRVTREQVEINLRLLGLVIMQNSLKPETTPVISQLHEARTRTVMITGDNLMTAVSVARDCGMVAPDKSVVLVTASLNENNHPGTVSLLPLYGPPPCKEMVSWFRGPSLPFHLALDGDTWSVIYSHFPEVLPSIITCGTVFARMAPEQKTQVVEELMAMDYVVAMVGDGANDCGALKVAHIGVSLSGAESSVAAPFTSRKPDITCLLHLMQEGRCALTTSYCTFKYMSVYSIIQLITALILYTQGAMMSNMEFLYVDLFITTTLAVVMGRTGPMNNLDVTRPVGSLMSYVIVVPILLQLALCFIVQEAALLILQLQPWYTPLNLADAEDDEGVVVSWETTVVYGVSCFQYVVIAMAYSRKSPFRKPGYTNFWLVIVVVALLFSSTMILAYPPDFLVETLELLPRASGQEPADFQQNWFRIWILALPVLHFFGALLIEECIADTRWLKRFLHWLFRKKEYKNKYKKVDHNLCLSSRWTVE